MADPISVLASLYGFLSSVSVGPSVAEISRSEAKRQKALLKRRYGKPIAFAVTFLSNDIAIRYERVERDVLSGSAADALAFKQAITDECNMTAITGAIVAQVAITGLSLPDLSSTHWVARAFLLVAVIAGCLTVYFACYLQRTVGTLFQPESIKSWLRIPPSSQAKQTYDFSGASLAAILIVSTPFNMIKVSIFAFLISLDIYHGFIWTRNLDASAGKGDSRSVFITFLVATAICMVFFTLTFATKRVETLLRIGRSKDQGLSLEEHTANHESTGSISSVEQGVTLEHRPVQSRHGSDEIVAGGLAAALRAASHYNVLTPIVKWQSSMLGFPKLYKRSEIRPAFYIINFTDDNT